MAKYLLFLGFGLGHGQCKGELKFFLLFMKVLCGLTIAKRGGGGRLAKRDVGERIGRRMRTSGFLVAVGGGGKLTPCLLRFWYSTSARPRAGSYLNSLAQSCKKRRSFSLTSCGVDLSLIITSRGLRNVRVDTSRWNADPPFLTQASVSCAKKTKRKKPLADLGGKQSNKRLTATLKTITFGFLLVNLLAMAVAHSFALERRERKKKRENREAICQLEFPAISPEGKIFKKKLKEITERIIKGVNYPFGIRTTRSHICMFWPQSTPVKFSLVALSAQKDEED